MVARFEPTGGSTSNSFVVTESGRQAPVYNPPAPPSKPPNRPGSLQKQLSDLGRDLAGQTLQNGAKPPVLDFRANEAAAPHLLNMRDPAQSNASATGLLDFRGNHANAVPSAVPNPVPTQVAPPPQLQYTPQPAPQPAASQPPLGQAVAAVHEANVSELVTMGFSREAAEAALAQAKVRACDHISTASSNTLFNTASIQHPLPLASLVSGRPPGRHQHPPR